MRSNFHRADVLFRLPLFTVLAFTIFFGCSTYSHMQSSQYGTLDIQLHERTKFTWIMPRGSKQYSGPQTAQGLMKVLDADYNRGHSKTEVSVSRKVSGVEITKYNSNLTLSEIDVRYPRAEWLQLLLDSGITIENFDAYAYYLSKRHTLAFLEDTPDLWRAGIHNIPPTNDQEIYKVAYIDKLVRDHAKKWEIPEQIERTKAQGERHKAQVERAKKEHYSQQLEDAQKQFEDAQKQLEHARQQLERAREVLERAED